MGNLIQNTNLYAVIIAVAAFIIILLTFQWLLFLFFAFIHRFSLFNTLLLINILQRNYVKNPLRLFRDKEFLKQTISQITAAWEKTQSEKYKTLLENLYRLRGGMENQGKAKKEITSSRQIPIGQKFSLTVNDNENITAHLIENSPVNLILELSAEPGHINRIINVFFWHDRIGYGFQSVVAKRENLIIRLPHTETLLQRQRRMHTRVKTEDIIGNFYLINPQNKASHLVTPDQGFPCLIRDISEGGIAITAEGRGQVNLYIRVDFSLNNKKITLYGEVRAVTYNSENNTSVLHMQNDVSMPFEMKEPILSYIYGINSVK
jgi:hypothetical protein